LKEPDEKKANRPHDKKPGVTPGDKEHERAREGPGTITEVAPEARRSGGPIKEVAPDVGKVRPEVAPDVRSGRPGPIQEMAPDVGRGIHPEIAPDVLSGHRGTAQLLYGPTIYDAIAHGDLHKMRDVVRQAEQQLATMGDLRAALEVLKIEIAKLERKHK
jgi:hypothetical protein